MYYNSDCLGAQNLIPHIAENLTRKEKFMKKKIQNDNINNDTKKQSRRTSKKKMSSFKKKCIVGTVAALAVLLYGVGVYHYKDHFHRSISVNDTRLGGMTVEEAENTFTQDFASHKIIITEKERKEIINPQDVDAVIDVGTQIQDLKNSLNPWLWFTDFFGKEDYTIVLDVTYDEEKLQSVVDNLECFAKENVAAPEDAYIKAGDTQFEIVPEVLGNTVKKNKLIELIGTDLATCVTSIDLEKENLYKLPSYYEKDEAVQQALETANLYTHGTITYDFKYTTETLDYNTTKDWIDISDDFQVTINGEKVGDYVSDLGKKYNTMGASRNFKTSSGQTINAYGGDYGWKIYYDKEKEKLIKNLKSGKEISREPVYSYTAQCRNSAKDDIGDSYVEVSIARQEIWLYINGECKVNSSIVTGNPAGYETYTGVYSITYKKSPDVLRGLNSNGSSYESKVTYWMPFNGNQGLHDATWRDSFGGSIYKSNGSHGCVNLPYSTAAVIYKYVDAGFPVVIY